MSLDIEHSPFSQNKVVQFFVEFINSKRIVTFETISIKKGKSYLNNIELPKVRYPKEYRYPKPKNQRKVNFYKKVQFLKEEIHEDQKSKNVSFFIGDESCKKNIVYPKERKLFMSELNAYFFFERRFQKDSIRKQDLEKAAMSSQNISLVYHFYNFIAHTAFFICNA